MNYSIIALEHTLYMNRVLNDTTLHRLEREAEFILQACESSLINIDSYDILQESFADKIREILNSVKEFFKKVFNNFMDKAKTLLENFKQWFERNKDVIEKIDFKNVTIESTPYWKGDKTLNDALKTLESMRDKHINAFVAKAIEENKLIETLSDLYVFYRSNPDIQKIVGNNENRTDAAKNYFRLGNPEDSSERVTLTGEALKVVVDSMVAYCINYLAKVVNNLVNQRNKTEVSIRKIDSFLNTTPTKESFSLLENAHFSNTSLFYTINSYVLEAEEPKKDAATTSQETKDAKPESKPATGTYKNENKTGKPEPGKVIDNNDKEQVSSYKEDKTLSKMNTTELRALRNLYEVNKMVITSAMTVSEEKFNYYFSILRQIVDSQTSKKETKKETETTETNDENTKKEEQDKNKG